MKGMSPDEIKALVANSRTRNTYGPKLEQFLNSDEAGIDVAEVWPIEFGEKAASTLYQGFLGAVKKAGLEDLVTVKQSDEKCFLLHNERYAIVLAELSVTTEAV